MAGKEIAVKKYVVRLDAEERNRLDELIRKGKRSAQLLTKARILLKADVSDAGEGWSDSRIAAALDLFPGHESPPSLPCCDRDSEIPVMFNDGGD